MLGSRWFSWLTVCLLLSYTGWVQSANIIFLLAFASKSHKAVSLPLINELAQRGHQLTIISPYISNDASRSPGIRDIVPSKASEFFQQVKLPFGTQRPTAAEFWGLLFPMITNVCEITYSDPQFQAFLNDQSQTFDLAIVDSLFNECMLPVVHHFQVPFIYLSASAPPTWVLEAIGAPNAAAYLPDLQSAYTSRMSFLERFDNVFKTLFNIYYRKYVLMPQWNTFARRFLPNTPDLRDVDSNVSFLLTNTHPSITYQFPSNPAISEVGAMHCKPAQPLPQDLEDFVNSTGDNGFIIVSFGSILRGVDMPLHIRHMFVKAFRRISQGILWKWEKDEKIDGLSDNVRLLQWLPQQDLLGHPKIKAFITHGGLLSTHESVYHGCPLIGLPVLGDQSVNLVKAANDGYAIHLSWDTLTEEIIFDAIQTVVNDPSYSTTVKQISKILRDQPETPVQRAVYWVEYVIRHQGAQHLRSPARELTLCQIYMIDIILFVVFVALFLILTLVLLLRTLRARFFTRSKPSKKSKTH